MCRTVQVQARGRGGSGRVPQGEPKAELHMQEEADSHSQHRQEHREGPSGGGGERVAAAEPIFRGGGSGGGSGGLHQLRRRVPRSRPLRHLLGDQGGGGRQAPPQVLHGDGRVLCGPWLRGVPQDPLHWAPRAPPRRERHLQEDSRPFSGQRGRPQPVQDPQVH